jgi:hypothetical protein
MFSHIELIQSIDVIDSRKNGIYGKITKKLRNRKLEEIDQRIIPCYSFVPFYTIHNTHPDSIFRLPHK